MQYAALNFDFSDFSAITYQNRRITVKLTEAKRDSPRMTPGGETPYHITSTIDDKPLINSTFYGMLDQNEWKNIIIAMMNSGIIGFADDKMGIISRPRMWMWQVIEFQSGRLKDYFWGNEYPEIRQELKSCCSTMHKFLSALLYHELNEEANDMPDNHADKYPKGIIIHRPLHGAADEICMTFNLGKAEYRGNAILKPAFSRDFKLDVMVHDRLGRWEHANDNLHKAFNHAMMLAGR